MPEPIQVLIADDHPIVRKGLVEIIHEHPDIRCIAEAGDGLEALNLVRKLEPHIAILDLDMPLMNGLDVCRKALASKPITRFAILTMHKEESFYNEAMECGVSGYMLKDAILTDLVECIRTLHRGKTYISPSVEKFISRRNEKQLASDWAKKYDLTVAELNVLKLVAAGKTTREIAGMLFVSEKTVETHRGNCVRKLGLGGEKNALMKFLLENKNLF